MAIIRAKKNKNYTIICNSIFSDASISARAKGIWSYIMTLPDNWQIKKSEIYRHFSEGRDALNKAFTELESKGYIKKELRKCDSGKFDGYDYTVIENAENGIESEKAPEKPAVSAENPLTENQLTENPHLLSTNKQSTYLKDKEYVARADNPRFYPPSIEQVSEYIQSKRYSVNARDFLDYYTQTSWVDGQGKAVKSWKQKVITWEMNGRNRKNGTGKRRQNFNPNPATANKYDAVH